MSGHTEMLTNVQDPNSGPTSAGGRSVAVIGPDDARRKIVTAALANSDVTAVREFSAYPATPNDIERMLEQQYDVVMIDVDSDENCALQVVVQVTAQSSATVLAYSRRNDPNLPMLCMRAGAHDFLPLPTGGDGDGGEATQAASADDGPGGAADRRPAEEQGGPEIRIYKGATYAKGRDGRWHLCQAEGLPPATLPVDFNAWEGGEVNLAPPEIFPAPQETPPSAIALEPIATMELSSAAVPSTPEETGRTPGGVISDAELHALLNAIEPEERPQEKAERRIWPFAVGGGVVVLTLVLLAFMHPFRQHPQAAHAAESAVPQAETSTTDPPLDMASAQVTPTTKPLAGVLANGAGTQGSQQATPQALPEAPQARASQVSSAMMDEQLAAPSRIPSAMKKPTQADQAPASLTPGALENNGSLPGTVFSGVKQAKVVPVVSAISAGVAAGMLIYKTQPVYPTLAQDARMSGTVVLKATITKTGTIGALQVISGPPIFSNAAVNAVKSWRYRPYMLNNEPVEVGTTISVVFSLDHH